MRTTGRKATGRRYWLSCFSLVGVLVLVLVLALGAFGAGMFRVGMLEPIALDPATIEGDAEIAIANAVYDYLVDVSPDNRIVPRLATAWTVSEDGLSYTFTLAEGVHFHDGSPLVPGDIAWSFDRLRDPELGFATSSLYANIDRIDVTGPSEVTFTLKTTNPFFLFDLSDNRALVLKRGTTDFASFNGTGPFIVVDSGYRPGERILMRANPDYFVEGQPQLDNLEFIFFKDHGTAVDALRGGQIDMTWRMGVDLFEGLQGISGLVTVDVETNAFDLVRFRTDQAPGNDVQVMQALKHATNREAILQVVQLGLGATGNDSPVGPMFTELFDPSVEPLAYDPEEARRLLSDAGYGDGLTLELTAPDSGSRRRLAQALKAQWAEVGVDVDLNIVPESVYWSTEGWLEVNLGITNWGSRPYPQFYLTQMFTCAALPPDGWNESRFCDEAFDSLVSIAGSTADPDELLSTYSQIQRTLADEGPVLILYFWPQVAAYSDAFSGVELKAFAGRTDFRTVLEK